MSSTSLVVASQITPLKGGPIIIWGAEEKSKMNLLFLREGLLKFILSWRRASNFFSLDFLRRHQQIINGRPLTILYYPLEGGANPSGPRCPQGAQRLSTRKLWRNIGHKEATLHSLTGKFPTLLRYRTMSQIIGFIGHCGQPDPISFKLC